MTRTKRTAAKRLTRNDSRNCTHASAHFSHFSIWVNFEAQTSQKITRVAQRQSSPPVTSGERSRSWSVSRTLRHGNKGKVRSRVCPWLIWMVQWDQVMQWGDFQSAFYEPSGMNASNNLGSKGTWEDGICTVYIFLYKSQQQWNRATQEKSSPKMQAKNNRCKSFTNNNASNGPVREYQCLLINLLMNDMNDGTKKPICQGNCG